MKQMMYRLPLGAIVMAGLVVGMVKGQEVRQKWVSKMKHRIENPVYHAKRGVVMLDDIEMATYHS